MSWETRLMPRVSSATAWPARPASVNPNAANLSVSAWSDSEAPRGIRRGERFEQGAEEQPLVDRAGRSSMLAQILVELLLRAAYPVVAVAQDEGQPGAALGCAGQGVHLLPSYSCRRCSTVRRKRYAESSLSASSSAT